MRTVQAANLEELMIPNSIVPAGDEAEGRVVALKVNSEEIPTQHLKKDLNHVH